jgi:porin
MRRPHPAAAGHAALLLIVACGALASAARVRADALDDWLQQKSMTGDWGGFRTDLEQRGLTLRAHYISEAAANPVGGVEQSIKYTQQVDFGADADLGKLVGLKGGQLHVTFSDRAGRSLAADDIGNIISVQEIFGGGQNFRLAELSYQQSLLDDRLALKLGRIHVTDDFANSPLYCYFQNNGFCGQPAGIPIDSGVTTFPVASWGGTIKVRPQPDLYLETGAYEVNPTLADKDNGFKLSTSGATGVVVPVEAGWHATLGRDKLPGNYKIGGYYDSSDTADLGDAFSPSQQTLAGRWGLYVLADQMLWREASGSDRGLTVFGVFVYAQPGAALIQYFWEAGLLYRGTFRGRDQDTIGLAVNQSRISSKLVSAEKAENRAIPGAAVVQSAETDIELNYRVQVAPWLAVMPNLQLVVRPNADKAIPTALVLGFQTGLTF